MFRVDRENRVAQLVPSVHRFPVARSDLTVPTVPGGQYFQAVRRYPEVRRFQEAHRFRRFRQFPVDLPDRLFLVVHRCQEVL